jgi:hypothetical protein
MQNKVSARVAGGNLLHKGATYFNPPRAKLAVGFTWRLSGERVLLDSGVGSLR